MITEISVAGANCPWCLNETLSVLSREPGVRSARAAMSGACLRVEHDGVADARLLAVVRGFLFGTTTSSSEHVMVGADARLAELQCRHGRHIAGAPAVRR